MLFKGFGDFYFILFLYISVCLFSILNYSVATLDFIVLDLMIFYFLGYVFILAILSKRVIYKINISPPAIFLILHFFVLGFYPVFGLFFKDILDVSVVLRWLELAVFLLLFFCFIPANNNFVKGLRNALFISGGLNFIYGLLMLFENLGLIPYGLLPHHTLSQLFQWKTDHRMRVPALFAGPNQLGWYSLLTILLSAGVLADSRFKYEGLWFAVLLIHVLLLFMSTSRTAILVLFFIVFLLAINFIIKIILFKKLNKIHLLILVLFFLLVVGVFLTGSHYGVFRLNGLLNAFKVIVEFDSTQDGSFNYRLILWDNALNIFYSDHSPFGTMVTTSYFTSGIDSGWIGYFVQSGFLYVLTFILFLMVSMIYSIFLFFRNRGVYICLALFLASFSISVGMITLTVFHYLPVVLLMVAMIKLLEYKNNH